MWQYGRSIIGHPQSRPMVQWFHLNFRIIPLNRLSTNQGSHSDVQRSDLQDVADAFRGGGRLTNAAKIY